MNANIKFLKTGRFSQRPRGRGFSEFRLGEQKQKDKELLLPTFETLSFVNAELLCLRRLGLNNAPSFLGGKWITYRVNFRTTRRTMRYPLAVNVK